MAYTFTADGDLRTPDGDVLDPARERPVHIDGEPYIVGADTALADLVDITHDTVTAQDHPYLSLGEAAAHRDTVFHRASTDTVTYPALDTPWRARLGQWDLRFAEQRLIQAHGPYTHIHRSLGGTAQHSEGVFEDSGTDAPVMLTYAMHSRDKETDIRVGGVFPATTVDRGGETYDLSAEAERDAYLGDRLEAWDTTSIVNRVNRDIVTDIASGATDAHGDAADTDAPSYWWTGYADLSRHLYTRKLHDMYAVEGVDA